MIIIFTSMFLSWIDILVTGLQYRALLFIFGVAFLSLLLIVIFVGLSAEWLRAWSSSSDQQLHPHNHILTGHGNEGRYRILEKGQKYMSMISE